MFQAMNKRLLALLLVLAMLLGVLTGCNSGAKTEEDAADDEIEATEVPESGEDTDQDTTPAVVITDEIRSDPVAYVTNGTIHMNDTVMTVNGVDVPAGVYFYLLSYQYFQASSFYANYGMELDLSQTDENGMTVADSLREMAQKNAVRYVLLNQKGEELNLELTQDQLDQMNSMMSYVDENVCLFYTSNLDSVKYINQASLFAGSMQDYYFGENGPEAPTDQTLQDFAGEQGSYTCRYILLRTDDLDENDADGKAAQLKKAQELYDQLVSYDGSDLEAKFAELQAEYNADGNTEPFTFDESTSLVEGFRERLAELKPGELGLTDETGYGYFVLLRLDTDLDSVREDYVSSRLGAMMDQWMDAASTTTSEALNALDMQACLEKVSGLQSGVMVEFSSKAEADAAQVEEEAEEAEEAAQPEAEGEGN
jgi:hypothetical protein